MVRLLIRWHLWLVVVVIFVDGGRSASGDDNDVCSFEPMTDNGGDQPRSPLVPCEYLDESVGL